MQPRENSYVPEDALDVCPHDIFYSASGRIDPNGLYIQMNRAGIVMQTPHDFVYERDESNPYSTLMCVVRGEGTLSHGGHALMIHSGQIIVLPPNDACRLANGDDAPLGIVWLEYGGGGGAQLSGYIANMSGPVLQGRLFTNILNLSTALFYQVKQEGPDISLKIYEILMRLCNQVESDTVERGINRRILEYIEKNINRRLSLTEVSSAFGYHPAYFSGMFAKTMGTTFSKYVMGRRISHSCYLLENTSWTVERIAQEMGFYDVSHFIQRFRELKDITPLAYRNRSKAYQNRIDHSQRLRDQDRHVPRPPSPPDGRRDVDEREKGAGTRLLRRNRPPAGR